MYIKNPSEIENRSMEIIDEAIGSLDFSKKELLIAKRMIHTTGDVGYKDIIRFKNDAAEVGEKLLKQGARMFTDTRMAWSGINKKALEKSGSSLKCYIDDPRAAEYSKANSTTRSSAAIDIAVEDNIDIFVIGNAPTALFRLGELIKEGTIAPKLIIGVPVGFVGAAESKEYIRGFMVPTISTEGTKGGSNVAASIVNALLYMAVGR